MDEQQQTTPSGRVGQLKRRGLIAAAAALGAAWLARLAGPERAQAAHDGSLDQTVLHVDLNNTTASTTQITRSGSAATTAFFVNNQANGGVGIFSLTAGAGSGSAGVFGGNNSLASGPTSLGGFGVIGQNGNSSATTNGIGVLGRVSAASSVGVRGTNMAFSPSAVAVQGLSGDDGTGPGIGVHGKSAGIGVEGDSTNSVGVIGRATAAGNPNPGIIGSATNGYGVFGFSANSNGIAGQTGTSAAGCVGFAGAAGGYGIYGGTAVQGGYAGGFAGPVLVVGDFTATGGAKSAAVPHPDRTHRRLYCMESPESWFEDFGKGRLANGRGEVKLDADFSTLVHGDDYHIFLTPRGDSNGLYVNGLTSSGFEVREQKGGASSLDFDYRVVAKRKDIPAPRLEKVKLPNPIKELVKPDLPKPFEPPKAPEPPRPHSSAQ
ncbi:MAG TPA: hypothetical protein VEQ11_05445 [Chloroflexota bacterium]|nr:hypothetical protein [Chloroflexota bacterium]